MSTDFTVLCDKHQLHIHIGQRFTSGPCFGYGSRDEEGRAAAAEFVSEHIYCGSLRIVPTDDIPEHYKDLEDG